MADYKKYQSDGVSAEDKALDKFAEIGRASCRERV